jgi:DNA-binding beta-propeller fold protein YncE/mono/diheme cytochrome c family protein
MRTVWTATLVAALVGACARPPTKAPTAKQAPHVEPIGATGTGNVLALARVNGRRLALVADEDAKAVITFDVDTKQELAQTPVGGRPGQLHVARDGWVHVTVRDANKLLALRFEDPAEPLAIVKTATTPAEPIGLATTPDESTLVVTSGWGQKLAAFDAPALAPRFETKLSREPRGVLVSDDGRTAFVSHAVGSTLSAVDLGTRAVRALEMKVPGNEDEGRRARQSCQGFALAKSAAVPNRIFAPQVGVDPGDPNERSSGYGDEGGTAAETPVVAVIDEALARPLVASLANNPVFDEHDEECILPRAASIDPETKSLLVACFGIDTVVAYDAMSVAPSSALRRKWNVGAGPTGIAVDAARRQAFVFSQFDRTLSTLDLGGDAFTEDKLPVQKTALAPLPRELAVPTQLTIGRMLFHASGDPRIARDSRACASCHPDGRDDAITWATPDGPRRSIMLAGRVGSTAPYSWRGNAATIATHLDSTFQRLRGSGLRPSELDALVTYVSSLPAPPARAIVDQAVVARGREIFHSSSAACSSCHSGPSFTDGEKHDVSSKREIDAVKAFNTPSLLLVGGAGPWFHDGRYATLAELLRDSDGKMGHTKHLSAGDLEALERYLETL